MLKLDEYSLEKFLGKGTFGEVYFTRKMNSPNLYATKRMSKQMVDDPKYNKYFINEISILRKLYHTNIIRIEDLKVTQNHYYIVMEYCNGGSLTQCLNRYKEKYHHPFTEEIVQYIMRQIIDAVKYIHSRRIIHRDLKLDNILVNFKNMDDYKNINLMNAQIKIIDFGFASTKDDNSLLNTAIGSPLNMDPLILKKFNAGRAQTNDTFYDEKADIWSIGALCYQMLIGNSPFDAYNMQELVEKVEEGNYKVPTNLSKEVVSFLNGMLQYDPQKRLTAENLYNHAFLTKNVSEFTHINTNMIARNVYGGQLNINIKNNQSIWAIFNEENQRTFDNISMNLYTKDKPLSESVYVQNIDNSPGISPGPYNAEQNFINNNFQKTDSVPIPDVSKSGLSPSSPMDEVITMGQVTIKNPSGGLTPYYPPQPNQYNQATANIARTPQINNNQMKPQDNIVTFKNGYIMNEEKEPYNNQYQYQNMQQNYQMREPAISNKDIRENIEAIKAPTVKQNRTPYDRMQTYPQINNQNRNQYVPNQRPPMNQIQNPMMMNNQQNGYASKPNIQPQQPPRQAVQNPRINQFGVNMRNNVNAYQRNAPPQNTNAPGQLNIINRNINLSPNRYNAYPKIPAQIARPAPIAQIKQQNILNKAPGVPTTPTKRPVFNIYNNQTNQKNKNVRPIMQLQTPLRRVPSNPNLAINNMNLAQPQNPQNIIKIAVARKPSNNAIVQQPVQNVVNHRYVYRNNPQRQIVVNPQRMQYVMAPANPF